MPRKKRKDRESLSDTTTEGEMEQMGSDSPDHINFTLNKDKSEVQCDDEVQQQKEIQSDILVINGDSVGKHYAVYYTDLRVIDYWEKK